MSIKRFVASKDNTITNAFKENLTVRGETSNMGASDILEIFYISGSTSDSDGDGSLEKARVLMEFPINEISAARSNGDIPGSGSVSFKLKVYNAVHGQTVPKNFKVAILPITRQWNEGLGLDMENYSDLDESNWLSASNSAAWTTPGGDFSENAKYIKFFTFDSGIENLEVDISEMVEGWIASDIQNYGLGIKMTGSFEADSEIDNDGLTKSHYTKRFFARGSQYFFKKPVIEAQWDNSVLDKNSQKIVISSSWAPEDQNINSFYFYNTSDGVLEDINFADPNNKLSLAVATSSVPVDPTNEDAATFENINTLAGATTIAVDAVRIDKGVYKAEFLYTASATPPTSAYTFWMLRSTDNSHILGIATGSQVPVEKYSLQNGGYRPAAQYITNITNLKTSYRKDEKAFFRVYTRDKNWNPNIYTVASAKAPVNNIREAYYKVCRVVDNTEVINYSTASNISYSRLSYDASGSFFNLDMSLFEPNYLYEISFLTRQNKELVEQSEKFRFRVEK